MEKREEYIYNSKKYIHNKRKMLIESGSRVKASENVIKGIIEEIKKIDMKLSFLL